MSKKSKKVKYPVYTVNKVVINQWMNGYTIEADLSWKRYGEDDSPEFTCANYIAVDALEVMDVLKVVFNKPVKNNG